MTRSLRIALVVNPFTLKVRGLRHAPQLAREMLGRGHTVRGFGAPPKAIPRSGAGPAVDGGVAPEEGIGLLGFRPEVIVAYDALSPAAWLGARRARKLRVPLVLVEEGFPEEGRPIERFLRGVGQRLWGIYVRRTASRVIALDSVARRQALDEGFPEGRIVTLPAGIDLARFRPGLSSDLPSRHGIRGRVVLHVGAIEDGRGLDVLVEAFAATVGRRGDWSLVFAGDGGARRQLRALVDRHGVGANVHWIGMPRPEELPGLFGASTLYASPALEDGAAARNARRAMACGLPLIASDVPRLADLVEPDGSGLLVEPGDTAAWGDALRLAASAPMRRERWRRRSRELAEERFAWPVVAEEIERLLLSACEVRQTAEPTVAGEVNGREAGETAAATPPRPPFGL